MAQEKKIKIRAPFGQPMNVMCCDHYAIFRNGDFTDLDFVCDRSGQCLSVRMATEVLDGHRESFLRYLNETGMPDTPAPRQFRIAPTVMVPADLVGMSRHQGSGEIVFHAISWQCALEQDKDEDDFAKERPAYFVAAVRCSLDVQRHWIGTLYEV